MSECAAEQGPKSDRGLSSKRELSNRKRLQALRKRSVQRNVSLPPPTGRHIVFDSDDFSDDHQEQSIPLFAGSDSDSSDGEEYRFSQHRSMKVLNLQRRIGHDQRFKLDERFIGSDSDDRESENYIPENELEVEKQQALQILDSMVPSSGATKPKEATFQQIYDPEEDQSESSVLDDVTSDDEGKALPMKDEHSSVSSNTPAVNNERFYSVRQDLNSGLTAEPFSFEFIEEDCQETPQPLLIEQSIHSSPAQLLAIDWETVEIPKQKTGGDQYQLLFFHWDHPTLQNRRAEGSFCRKSSVEQLMTGWDLRRTSIKSQYKRARKNALRKKSRLKS